MFGRNERTKKGMNTSQYYGPFNKYFFTAFSFDLFSLCSIAVILTNVMCSFHSLNRPFSYSLLSYLGMCVVL